MALILSPCTHYRARKSRVSQAPESGYQNDAISETPCGRVERRHHLFLPRRLRLFAGENVSGLAVAAAQPKAASVNVTQRPLKRARSGVPPVPAQRGKGRDVNERQWRRKL